MSRRQPPLFQEQASLLSQSSVAQIFKFRGAAGFNFEASPFSAGGKLMLDLVMVLESRCAHSVFLAPSR
jgi:hypothetical protein